MEQTKILELEKKAELCPEKIAVYRDSNVEGVDKTSFSAKISFDIGAEICDLCHETVLLLIGEKGYPVSVDMADSVKVSCVSNVAEFTVSNLPLAPKDGAFELVVRPYVMGEDGLRRYGVTKILYYRAKKDEKGYPILSQACEETYQVIATDDTYIFNENNHFRTDSFAKETQLHVRNTGDENTRLYRAAYYKFTLDTEAVRLLDTDTPVKLRLYVSGVENDPSRKYYDMMVYSTDVLWNEQELNFVNHNKVACIRELIEDAIHCESGYMNVDIADFLKKQDRNEDGTITVSFCVSAEGHSDASLVRMNSKEAGFGRPMIEFGTPNLNSIAFYLPTKANIGFDPWGYGKMLADEWFLDLRDKIYPKDENGNLLYHDEYGEFSPAGYAGCEPSGDFTQEIKWVQITAWNPDGSKTGFEGAHKDKYVRTLETLGTASGKPFMSSPYAEKIVERDIYGGIANAGIKGEATGFFHTEKLGKRIYIIDPLGNPYFAIGVNTVVLGDSDNHKRYSLEKFGTEQAYFDAITDSLQDMGINTCFESTRTSAMLDVKNGLACAASISMIGTYMRNLGRGPISEGKYPHNNTINVFDPDFVKCAYENTAKRINEGGYANMPQLFGYTTDNEQPVGMDILDRYLLLDPSEPTNAFSYATAWSWVAARMNKPIPTLEEFQNSPEYKEMNIEFLGFMYARYSRVSRDAIKAADKNHMYIGSRVFFSCLTEEGYLRAAGYYLDIITANLYGNMNPSAKTLTNLYRYSGKPFIVTEFYAKAADAMDANGFKLGNSCGAGLLVEKQKDRADYYEHYALALLESGACVGWTWYRYRDNDQGLYRKKGTDNTMYMCHVTYGKDAHANSFMDETGKILMASEVGEFEEIYHGERLASNQNANKGIYTCKFNSVVTVYTYDETGNLIDSMGYEVQTPKNEKPAEGTQLKALNGDATYTIGTQMNQDGSYTETILTVYEGKYISMSNAIRRVSDHVWGLVDYFDAK